jgi:23S rRNA (pseudouridine1915-N3)-methyltransferase
MRIRIVCEGKLKDAHLRALAADYQKRIARFVDITVEETKPLRGTGEPAHKAVTTGEKRLLEKLKECKKVLLDERGRERTSQEFAEWLGEQALRGTREIAFVVGGPDGFSETFRREADPLMALSRMTLTHDWARVLLLEQIYRGFTILRGYPYPR